MGFTFCTREYCLGLTICESRTHYCSTHVYNVPCIDAPVSKTCVQCSVCISAKLPRFVIFPSHMSKSLREALQFHSLKIIMYITGTRPRHQKIESKCLRDQWLPLGNAPCEFRKTQWLVMPCCRNLVCYLDLHYYDLLQLLVSKAVSLSLFA